jgi:hypothetical protein
VSIALLGLTDGIDIAGRSLIGLLSAPERTGRKADLLGALHV